MIVRVSGLEALPRAARKPALIEAAVRRAFALNKSARPGEVAVIFVSRAKMRALNGALSQLADDCQSTELVLGSDIADHDKAFYAAIRLAAQNGVAGAQAIYDDLKQRYPSVPKKPAIPKLPTP